MAWRLFTDAGPRNGPAIPLYAGDPIGTMEELVLCSLLCDARDDDQATPRGYWGDAYADDGDRWGSRLWTIPGIATEENLRKTEKYAEEALDWMRRDELVTTIKATATRATANQIRLEIVIDGSTVAVLGGP